MMKVLIVDRHRTSAEQTSRFFQSQGCAIRVASVADVAVNHAREFRPNVVILDTGLRKQGGFELARVLKEMLDLQCCVIGIGGRLQLRPNSKWLDGYIRKPVSLEKLLSIIEQHSIAQDAEKKVDSLLLGGTHVTEAGLQQLQKALVTCNIELRP